MKITRRSANSSDSNFISSLILAGSRKQHFAINVDSAEAVKTMKQHVSYALTHGRLKTGLTCKIDLHLVNEQKAGFIMLIDMPEVANGIEIYAIAVAPAFKRQGLGGYILDQSIDPLYQYDIYARCAPQSIAMRHMLTSRGFFSVEANQTGDELFKRPAPVDHWMNPACFSSFEPQSPGN